jgi:glycosyltransferase involved in cell wall biosynthesis
MTASIDYEYFLMRPESHDPAPIRAARVSVICIFFEAERFLREAIDSVLAQDFGEFELILVDDGSTDTSTQIAKDYCAQNPGMIRYREHPGHVNKGACAARNLGLSLARGEFVAFMDADDRWAPSKLREQLDICDRFPEIDAVAGATRYWSSWDGGEDEIVPTGHVQGRAVRPPEGLLRIYPLGRAEPPAPSDLFLRRSTVEAIGGFEESFTGPLQMYEDQAFLTKFFLQGTIYFATNVWLDYRLHDQSCTAIVSKKGLARAVRQHCLEWFENYVRGTRFRYHPLVRLALFRALLSHRYPRITTALRVAKGLASGKPKRELCI